MLSKLQGGLESSQIYCGEAARGSRRGVTALRLPSPKFASRRSLSLFLITPIPNYAPKGNSLASMRSLFSVLQRTTPAAWTLPVRGAQSSAPAWKVDSICTRCRLQQKRQFSKSRQLTESLLNVDHPAKLVRVNQKHGPGLIILGQWYLIAALRRR